MAMNIKILTEQGNDLLTQVGPMSQEDQKKAQEILEQEQKDTKKEK